MKHTFSAAIVFLWVTLCGVSPQIEASPMNQPLDARQKAIVPIAAFTANGHLENLRTALNQGLNAGLSVNEIKEILVQMYAYCGFPRSLNSLGVFADVMKTREEKGIRDNAGTLPSPPPADKTSLELGTEVQAKLVGAPVKGGLMDFAPAIDEYLKAHLFGDIFGRDNLDWQSREIATVSALASMDGVESQLRSHFNISLNVGLTADQLGVLVQIIHGSVGKKEGDRARDILAETLQNRK